jgi:hypothetical protein
MEGMSSLKPGQHGTRCLLAQYGNALVCVRYRTDPLARKRYKTVELIVDEHSPPPAPWKNNGADAHTSRNTDTRQVLVRIRYAEDDLRERIKQADGRWLPDLKLWRMPRRNALAMGLRNRIVRATP